MAKESLFDSILDPDLLGFGFLSFQNHQKPMTSKVTLTEIQKKQVELIQKINDDISKSEMKTMDFVDIVNTETKKTLFQFYLYPYGSGKFFLNNTTIIFAEILQHGFEFVEKPKTRNEMVLAYRLLIDLDTAYENSKINFNEFLDKISAADFISDLDNMGINLNEEKSFIKYEKDCKKRIPIFKPKKTDGKVILNLSERKMKEIPSQIFQLTDLTDLEMGFNEINSIPNEIGNLINLQSLILNHNQIMNIPPEIGKLKNLKILNLTEGRFKTLPDEFYELIQLEELILSGVELESFSEKISQLKNLHSLTLNGSKTVPYNISKIPDLKELVLMNCGFTEIPGEVFGIKSLVFLNLNQNMISKIPSEVGNLRNLEKLYIGENKLEELPLELYHLKKLKDLYLFRNKLTFIDEEICNLESLEIINFGDNQIEILPKSIGKMKNLKEMEQYWTCPIKNVPQKIRDKGIEAVKKYLSEQ